MFPAARPAEFLLAVCPPAVCPPAAFLPAVPHPAVCLLAAPLPVAGLDIGTAYWKKAVQRRVGR